MITKWMLVIMSLMASIIFAQNIAQVDCQTICARSMMLVPGESTYEQTVNELGAPIAYRWGRRSISEKELPQTFLMEYPEGISILIDARWVIEIRYTQPEYQFAETIHIGSSLTDVLDEVGQPSETVEGKTPEYRDGVLYKDVSGTKGKCYYASSAKGVRFFFNNYKVTAIYVNNRNATKSERMSGGSVSVPTSESHWCDDKARKLVQFVSTGQTATALEQFNTQMREAVSVAQLASIWESIVAEHGAYQSIVELRVKEQEQHMIALVSCKYAEGEEVIRIVYDKNRQVEGIFTEPHASWTSDQYVDPTTFSERNVSFGSPPWVIAGVLTVPKRKSLSCPAIVLVHGSGPLDKDSSIGPNKPFRDLAWGLASCGIAVLRYDKRTYAYSGRMEVATTTVKEEVLDDAVAAIALLRRQPEVDYKRVFVLGHSLGGMLAPRIAVATHVAGVVIMAGNISPVEELVAKQVRYLATLDGAISDAEKAHIESVEQQMKRIQSLRHGETVAAGEVMLGAYSPYWRDLATYDPAVVARRVLAPMLFLQGGRDYQVTKEEYEEWQSALTSRKDVQWRLYPALNHLFAPGHGKSMPSDYLTPSHVDAQVIQEIATWINGLQ